MTPSHSPIGRDGSCAPRPIGDDVEELDAVDVGRAEIERQYRIGDRLLFQTDAPTLVVHDADGAEVGTVDGTLDLGALTASGGAISAPRSV
ncbi:MAG: hypothetical protein WKF58_15695 [Ilumatobacteraceae bacterium]